MCVSVYVCMCIKFCRMTHFFHSWICSGIWTFDICQTSNRCSTVSDHRGQTIEFLDKIRRQFPKTIKCFYIMCHQNRLTHFNHCVSWWLSYHRNDSRKCINFKTIHFALALLAVCQICFLEKHPCVALNGITQAFKTQLHTFPLLSWARENCIKVLK